jgi:hypothetical protein
MHLVQPYGKIITEHLMLINYDGGLLHFTKFREERVRATLIVFVGATTLAATVQILLRDAINELTLM